MAFYFSDELRQCKLRLEYASEEIIEQYGGMKDLPHNYIIKGSEEGTVGRFELSLLFPPMQISLRNNYTMAGIFILLIRY